MIALDDKKILLISIAVSMLALILGAIQLLGQWEYYEEGQGILLGIYAFGCFILFFALRFTKVSQIVASVALLGLILFYANVKFDWRKTYIDNAQNGNPFILEPYITQYPTLEENTFGFLWNEPQWVAFANTCVKPAIAGAPVEKVCRSNQSINDEFDINPTTLINTHYKKMQRTAQRIQDGDLKTKNAYQRCLMNKTCAIIPLLPVGVDAEKIDQQSTDHLKTRRMFWSLINDKEISPEICEYIDLCRGLRDIGVMPIIKPDPMLPQ